MKSYLVQRVCLATLRGIDLQIAAEAAHRKGSSQHLRLNVKQVKLCSSRCL